MREGQSNSAVLREAARFLRGRDRQRGRGGPQTKAGKAIAAQNARKHGVTSHAIEQQYDAGENIPDWLFNLRDGLVAYVDAGDPLDDHLMRKALIAAWRHALAEQALTQEMAALYPAADLAKSFNGWASDALHGVLGSAGIVDTAAVSRLSRYVRRFRAERDKAIRTLVQRSDARAVASRAA